MIFCNPVYFGAGILASACLADFFEVFQVVHAVAAALGFECRQLLAEREIQRRIRKPNELPPGRPGHRSGRRCRFISLVICDIC